MNDLIPLYREMAATGTQFRGTSILQHKDQIGKLIRLNNVRTLLDYGCGAGDAYKSPHKLWHEWGLKRPDVTLYDPAFEEHDKLPGKRFDMVIASDVLEHVPEADVDATVKQLFALSRTLVWASVCTRLAKKTFPQTGENLHVCVRPYQWWLDTFSGHAGDKDFVLVETP